jgi:uncharacterized protein (TIGR02271 family)
MSARKKDSDLINRRGTVVGLYRDLRAAEVAVLELKQAGFTDRQIKIVLPDQAEQLRFAKDTGIVREEARYYETGLREGRFLVTVDAAADADRAARILLAAGADFGPAAQFERLELREEELRVAKERVKAGEVRVRKEVVTEQRTIDVPVTHEEVVIERHPVAGRPAPGPDLKEGEEIRIPVTEEHVRVKKTPVVKEEITVGKREVTNTERVRDTVRKEEARIEEKGKVSRQPWRGKERRRRPDLSYAGPERRLVTS